MSKYWVVAVSIPMTREGYWEIGEALENAVGERSGSGTGFGYRDLEWTFESEEEANELYNKIVNYFSEQVIPTQDDFSDGDPVQIDISDYDRDEE